MITPGTVGDPTDFITLAERNATPALDSGRVAQLEADGFLDSAFIRFSKLLPTFEPINGASTPVAVMLDPTGSITRAQANNNDIDEFHGFVKNDYSAQTPAAFLNGAAYTASGGSFTVNAGTSRVLYIQFSFENVTGAPTMPTAVSWNGSALTQVASITSNRTGISIWRLVLGTSASGTTGTIVFSGHTATAQLDVFAAVYQFVDQTTPELATDTTVTTGSTTSITDDVTPTQAYTLVIAGFSTDLTGAPTLDGRLTIRQSNTTSFRNYQSDGYVRGSAAKQIVAAYSSSASLQTSLAVVLKNAVSTAAVVHMMGVIGGFTGLTPGAKYYLSNTIGAISTTPGTTSIYLGKAVSATELLIIQS